MKKFVPGIVLIFIFELSCKTADELPKHRDVVFRDTILFVGDMMFEWAVKDTINKYDVHYPLKKIQPFLHSFDLVVANLETPLTVSNECLLNQKYIFKASPDIAKAIAHAGIRAVTLSNNHMLDYGITGLLDTLVSLSSAGILYAGAGRNVTTASLPIIYKLNAHHIAILCYTQICAKDMIAKSTPGVNFFELKRVKEDIERYRFCDSIIVTLHWGNEYFYYPTSTQIDVAHALIDAGADAIIGHHPHVYQGIEIYKNKPIVYSLGNFLFGSVHEGIKDNIVCALYFSDKGKIVKMQVYAIKGRFVDSVIQPMVLNDEDARKIFEHIINISMPLGNRFSKEVKVKNNYMEYIFP